MIRFLYDKMLHFLIQKSWHSYLQLYKASGEMYVVDMQWLHGPPFLFLELCASFLSVVGII